MGGPLSFHGSLAESLEDFSSHEPLEESLGPPVFLQTTDAELRGTSLITDR